jgi:hypothetical protein
MEPMTPEPLRIPDLYDAMEDSNWKDILKRFTYHAPHGDQPQRYEALRSFARELAVNICKGCPPSRERSLALTKLEECVFWANAAIARNEQK